MTAKTGFRHNSPGPKYALSSTIGTECYDPTLKSYPAFVFGTVAKKTRKPIGPGPKYDITGYGSKGKLFSPAWYFGTKPKDTNMRTKLLPSPLSYGAHLCPDLRHPKPPAWELGDPYRRTYRMTSPAPKYMVPPITGATPPDLPAAPAFTILGRDALKLKKTASPGPGKYAAVDPQLYRTRAPTPAILPRRPPPTLALKSIPGPKYLSQYNWKNEPPSYTFGMKHSMYKVITYMPEDREPFLGI